MAVSRNSSQVNREAAFRAESIQVKENAESLALLGREIQTKERLLGTFGQVVGSARHIIAVNRNVAFFTTGFNYLVPVIPVFVVAHLFMWGRVEFGVITQSAMAFAQLMGALSLIVTQSQSMSSYVAVVNRIRALWRPNPPLSSSIIRKRFSTDSSGKASIGPLRNVASAMSPSGA